MKKTYIAPVLRSVELGAEASMMQTASKWGQADSSVQRDAFSSKNKNSGSPIWDNNLWGTADKD